MQNVNKKLDAHYFDFYYLQYINILFNFFQFLRYFSFQALNIHPFILFKRKHTFI